MCTYIHNTNTLVEYYNIECAGVPLLGLGDGGAVERSVPRGRGGTGGGELREAAKPPLKMPPSLSLHTDFNSIPVFHSSRIRHTKG